MEGNLEIITLNGTFSPKGVHLHLSLSDGDCQVWGGHLEPDTLVLKGADILLGLVKDETSKINNEPTILANNNPRIKIAVLSKCPWSSRAIRMLRALAVFYARIFLIPFC